MWPDVRLYPKVPQEFRAERSLWPGAGRGGFLEEKAAGAVRKPEQLGAGSEAGIWAGGTVWGQGGGTPLHPEATQGWEKVSPHWIIAG